jgi:hypothetical protein
MRGVAGIAAAAVTACALAFGIAYAVAGIDSQGGTVDQNRSYAPEIRIAGGAYVIDLNDRFAAAAIAFVGSDPYAVVSGPPGHILSTSVALTTDYFHGRLLPAKQVAPKDATWLLCYGCEPRRWPAFTSVWTSPPYAVLHRAHE